MHFSTHSAFFPLSCSSCELVYSLQRNTLEKENEKERLDIESRINPPKSKEKKREESKKVVSKIKTLSPPHTSTLQSISPLVSFPVKSSITPALINKHRPNRCPPIGNPFLTSPDAHR